MRKSGLVLVRKNLKGWCFLLAALALLYGVMAECSAPASAQERKAAPRLNPASGIDCCRILDYKDKAGNPVFGYVAYVDLTKTQPVVPAMRGDCRSGEYPNPAYTTEVVANASPGLSLFINANFFWWDQNKNFHDLACERALGLVVSEGQTITYPGEGVNLTSVLPDSILFFYDTTKSPQFVVAPKQGYTPPPGVRTAVSGIMILQSGVTMPSRAIEAKINWGGYEPRTAIGLTKDGKTLIVIVIEGGVPRSKGINLKDLAEMFVSRGAYTALNLDGGGSTTLNYYEGPNYQIMSAPKDTYPAKSTFPQYRPVPVTLSFIANQSTTVADQTVVGTPVPQDTNFSSMTVDASGSFSLINKAKLTMKAGTKFMMRENSTVIVNQDDIPHPDKFFQAVVTGPSTAPQPQSGVTNIKGIGIDSNGNVGIGTTTPNTKFSVQNNAGTQQVFNVSESGAVSAQGPLTLSKWITGLTVTETYDVRYYSKDRQMVTTTMTPSATSVCFLTQTYAHGSWPYCVVRRGPDTWVLGALSYSSQKEEVHCFAMCLVGVPLDPAAPQIRPTSNIQVPRRPIGPGPRRRGKRSRSR